MGLRAPTMRLTSLARQLWCRDGVPLVQPGTEEDGAAAAAAVTGGAAAAAAVGANASAMDIDGGAGVGAGPSGTPGPAAAPAAAAAAAIGAIPPPSSPPPEVTGLLAAAAPPEETAGALVLLNAPVLEYLVTGTTELKIGKHLFSGRLTLRPGQDERDEGSLHHAAEVAAVRLGAGGGVTRSCGVQSDWITGLSRQRVRGGIRGSSNTSGKGSGRYSGCLGWSTSCHKAQTAYLTTASALPRTPAERGLRERGGAERVQLGAG